MRETNTKFAGKRNPCNLLCKPIQNSLDKFFIALNLCIRPHPRKRVDRVLSNPCRFSNKNKCKRTISKTKTLTHICPPRHHLPIYIYSGRFCFFPPLYKTYLLYNCLYQRLGFASHSDVPARVFCGGFVRWRMVSLRLNKYSREELF